MTATNSLLYAFNRGIVSPLAIARTDLKRMALSAEVQTNFMPRTLGAMMLRPGTAYVGDINVTAGHDPKVIPFIFAATDTSLLEFSDGALRVWTNDAVVTRPSVSTALAGGGAWGGGNWTNDSGTGGFFSVSGGVAVLAGNDINDGSCYQNVTVSGGNIGKLHALRVQVLAGTVRIRIGHGYSDSTYMDTTIGRGIHSLAFTPTTGTVGIYFSNTRSSVAFISPCSFDSAGAMVLPTLYGYADLKNLRWDQSADVVYLACLGIHPCKIERRAHGSWSYVYFEPMDGPFKTPNLTAITLTPSALTGNITLTASESLFKPGHVGALFKLNSVGQVQTVAASGTNQWSGAIKIQGIGSAARSFAITITGTCSAKVQLQRSVGDVGAWENVPSENWTSSGTFNTATTYADGLDNQTIYYRIGIEGTYTSGTANCKISISTGSLTGVARVLTYNSPTVVNANVLTQANNTGVLTGLGSTTATADWYEGQWSDIKGYPCSVALHEGRLWWAGKDRILGSVSDGYETFDDTIVGDSGPINRSIGNGPVDTINWLLPLQRLLIGGQMAEKSARSSSFDSLLTPTDFVIKDASTQGSAAIPAAKIDYNGIFVQKSGLRLYQLSYSPNYFMMDYTASDLTALVPDIALAAGGIRTIAVQRQPDTRVHCVLNDGTAAVLVYDPAEEEKCWVRVTTPGATGSIVDVVILPGQVEDQVYYVVSRSLNATTYTLEKWSLEKECIGAAVSKCADCHIVVTNGSPSTTLSGLGALNFQLVTIWADGKDMGTDYVRFGSLTLATPVTNAVVGLPYTAQFQSAKLALGAQVGTPMNMRKRITRVGFVLANTHAQGLQYGPDFNTLDALPLVVDGADVDPNSIWSAYDYDMSAFPGSWNTDPRLCLQAASPRPATVLAATIDIETRERV